MIEKRGRVDLVAADQPVSGHYHLRIEEESLPDAKPTARGTIQLFDNPYLVKRALTTLPILACFDGQVELVLEVEAWEPQDGLISFTCRDASAFVRV